MSQNTATDRKQPHHLPSPLLEHIDESYWPFSKRFKCCLHVSKVVADPSLQRSSRSIKYSKFGHGNAAERKQHGNRINADFKSENSDKKTESDGDATIVPYLGGSHQC